MRIMISSSQVISATAQEEEYFPCSIMESAPWDIVLHKIPQCEFFLQATVLHVLLQHGYISMGCSPKGTSFPRVGPPQGHKGACSSMDSSLCGSAGPSQDHAPARASHGVTVLFWGGSPLHPAGRSLYPSEPPQRLQGQNLTHHGLHHSL